VPHSIYGPVENSDSSCEGERIAAEDLKAAIRIATERAFERIAADVSAGCLNPASCIVIQDETGKTVHIVSFEDLIDSAGRRPN